MRTTVSRSLALLVVSGVFLAAAVPAAPALADTPTPNGVAPQAGAATLGANLIVNGDAEAGAGSADGTAGGTPIPGWTVSGPALANQYAIPAPFIQASDPGPSSRGRNYFAGGSNNEFSQMSQVINVADQATLIDAARVRFTLSGWLGGFADQNDGTIVSAYFKNAQGVLIGEDRIGPVSAQDRGNATSLLYRERTGDVPANTRTIDVYVQFTRSNPVYNDGIADNLSLTLWQPAVPVTELPSALYRRALQHLEAMRGSLLAPGWDATVRLGSVARPLFRPDLGDTPAYYEFTVEKPTIGAQSADQPDAFIPSTPAGFIIVSTGEHDFPISHWNYEGDSPIQELTKKAFQSDRTPMKFLRLDALNYIAQDANGDKIAENGTPVNRIINQTKFSSGPVTLTAKVWSPIGGGADLSAPLTTNSAGGVSGVGAVNDISHTLTTSGPLTGTFVLTGWTSLSELKDGYVGSYGAMIDSLKFQASSDWQVENTAAIFGEALRKGDVYTLPLLTAASTASFSGVGVGYIQTQALTGGNGLPLIRITVVNDEAGMELPFTATITSPAEVARFVIIPPQNRSYLPSLTRDGKPAAVAPAASSFAAQGVLLPQAPQAPAATEGWGPWNYFWAGTSNDQRQYGQIPSNNGPNNTGCPSGCGGTAWAMLFGWADHQATLGNPRWASPYRGGIYRQNGGYGADADAPATRDAGVTAMTWEARNRIGTWCTFGSAPTLPWNMDSAQGYLTNRSYAHISTHYNVLGWHEDRLREYARNSIIYQHTPAVIGTGWLTHYPLAWGYAWRSRPIRTCIGPDLGFNCWNSTEYARFFYVNEGWPGNSSNFGWVSAGTWFAGELFP